MAEPPAAAPPGPEPKRSLRRRLFPPRQLLGRVLRTLGTLSRLSTEPAAGPAQGPAPGLPPGPPPPPPPGPPPAPRTPGLSGLKNHGNTCFMNAVLQCLSNTELFAEYLALEQYRGGPAEPPLEPPPEPPPEVTQQLAGLLRSLWTLEYTPKHSRDFKTVVSKNALQYRGNSQHDAQEFLLWLLDRVHEDLNSVVQQNGGPPIKPPLEEEPPPEGPSFPISGTFVQELFQAQYRQGEVFESNPRPLCVNDTIPGKDKERKPNCIFTPPD